MLPIKNSKGVVLRVPKTVLEANGFSPDRGGRRELVKLQVAWSTQRGEREEEVFANYYPGDRRAEVYLGRSGRGDGGFRIVRANRYGYADFVEDFERKKPLGLQNVRLGTCGDSLMLDVDGSRIGLSETTMSTFGSMVCLRGRLERSPLLIKFECDGMSATARFKEHPMIELMQVQGDELEIRYAQSKDEKHTFRMKIQNG
ncbi:MAG: hypothetical protein JRN34_00005 [Nitrososphaerota archaeon]|jgi:hypothetical protein|nr:hypothetical protein [Nitrososphaerota archaeon]MDG6943212.1 hypothetical protein [Nitrososphaerota archaeon]MDG6950910.1 hypothetical protein [Nitrososphaerota archaeon]